MIQPAAFTPLDLRAWPRGETFCYFARMAPTGYSLTVDVDVTRLRKTLRAAGLKFYPAYLWLTTRTLNEQPEFKLAEVEGQLGYYQSLAPFYAIFHPESKTFSMLFTEFDDCFPDFYLACLADQARFGGRTGFLARTDRLPPPNAYTVSCLPWVSFRHFSVQSYGDKPYYFPSLEAGKFFENEGKTLMPLSITCHHAAADGWHIARFLERWQAEADAFEQYL